MNTPSERRKERYTYADYLQWPDGERWEIIDGVPYNMSPAPSTKLKLFPWSWGDSWLISFLTKNAGPL